MERANIGKNVSRMSEKIVEREKKDFWF